MKLKVLYHGHCFDGVASAAVFSSFYLNKINKSAEVSYLGLLHRPGTLFDEPMFDGDENAIVDFKYRASERLTWWFDHHQSAFLAPEDEVHFKADRSGKKFWDPQKKSCTEFIYEIAREYFGFENQMLGELVDWAHRIDGALYESPAEPVELVAPALQLMQVIENVPDETFIETIIRALQAKRLDEVARSSEVQSYFKPIYERHKETLEAVRVKARSEKGVVFFDLAEDGFEGFNKFIPYYIFPEATYTVALTRGPKRTKISVGSNPWSAKPRTHNIASICERYGGGGHPVVGAVSYRPDELDHARKVCTEIVSELQS
jgi:hypothetical protein